MTRASRGSLLTIAAALALASCGRNGTNGNDQTNAAAAPDMASDTGMNTAETTMAPADGAMNAGSTDMNAGSAVDVGNSGAGGNSGNATGNNAPY